MTDDDIPWADAVLHRVAREFDAAVAAVQAAEAAAPGTTPPPVDELAAAARLLPDLREALAELERTAIEAAMDEWGTWRAAADVLGYTSAAAARSRYRHVGGTRTWPAGRPRAAGPVTATTLHRRVTASRNLPLLSWTVEAKGRRLTGHAERAGFGDDAERVDAARTWAAHLHLAPVEAPVEHSMAWAGQVEGVEVEVWAISDSAAWDAADAVRRLEDELRRP